MDIGCAEGFFCFEAKKRNAGRVVGIDINYERIKTAAKLSRATNSGVEFLEESVFNVEKLGKFDYVLCLNILHHTKDPIHVIHKLTNITKKTLILEVANIRAKFNEIGKKWWRPLFRILPDYIKPPVSMIDSKGKTVISKKWIDNFLNTIYTDIEKIEFSNSDRPNRYILKSKKREIKSLKIITGPSGVGKSHFLRRLESKDRATNKILNVDSLNDWDIISGQRFEVNKYGVINKLILHYDLSRPFKRGYLDYNTEPCLSVLRASEDKKCYVLFAPPKTLLERLMRVVGEKPKKRRKERADFMKKLYSDPKRIRAMYEHWLTYCEENGCEIKYIDVTEHDSAKEISKSRAFEIISQ